MRWFLIALEYAYQFQRNSIGVALTNYNFLIMGDVGKNGYCYRTTETGYHASEGWFMLSTAFMSFTYLAYVHGTDTRGQPTCFMKAALARRKVKTFELCGLARQAGQQIF